MRPSFRVLHHDRTCQARTGLLRTRHGTIETPVFMPVGTSATVKAIPNEFLERLDSKVILANTYHLFLRPGEEVLGELGGLHRFMGWDRAILTDSGGYQVFSHRSLRKVSEEGVEFQSHIDGRRHFFSPEDSIRVQETLGSDLIMVLDECTPYPVSQDEALESMRRSLRWARRCQDRHGREEQMLFGIVQGGMFLDPRKECLERLIELDFAGIALGGFSVGEPKLLMYDLVEKLQPYMPRGKPRYLMGVGTPQDLVFCVKQGIDMFDCVIPTRNARNGTLYTSQGKINIKQSRYRRDPSPLDPECDCIVCQRHSKAYLRHLFVSGEILASVLNTYHNLHFYLDLMRKIRQSIALDSLLHLERELAARYSETA
jgi:queuine tRNA-ribosyltransferase